MAKMRGWTYLWMIDSSAVTYPARVKILIAVSTVGIVGSEIRRAIAISSLGIRWGLFCRWIRGFGVKKMENITRESVVQYGEYLREKVISGTICASTGQNYLSAVNRVMDIATHGKWRPVKPVMDCKIPRRKFIATENKASSDVEYLAALKRVTDIVKILMELQRCFGFRFRESALLDAKKSLKQAIKTGEINVVRGTKGGRNRIVTADLNGVKILERAAEFQTGISMVPPELCYVEFRRICYEESRESGIIFHSNRHHYAHRRYRELTGAPCPVEQSWTGRNRIPKLADYLNISFEDAKKIDHEARLKIALELGHGRTAVTGAYVG